MAAPTNKVINMARYSMSSGLLLGAGETLTGIERKEFVINEFKKIINGKLEKNGKAKIGIGRYATGELTDDLKLYMPEVAKSFEAQGNTVVQGWENNTYVYLISI